MLYLIHELHSAHKRISGKRPPQVLSIEKCSERKISERFLMAYSINSPRSHKWNFCDSASLTLPLPISHIHLSTFLSVNVLYAMLFLLKAYVLKYLPCILYNHELKLFNKFSHKKHPKSQISL